MGPLWAGVWWGEWIKFPMWWDTFSSVAQGTGCGRVISFVYVPNDEEYEDFWGQNQWIFVVLNNVIEFSEGKFILRKHHNSQDGRAVLVDLYKHARQSGAIDLAAQEKLQELTMIQLDRSWNKGYVEFINNFVTKAEIYNETQPLPDSCLNEAMLMTLLQRAVSTVSKLAEVRS